MIKQCQSFILNTRNVVLIFLCTVLYLLNSYSTNPNQKHCDQYKCPRNSSKNEINPLKIALVTYYTESEAQTIYFRALNTTKCYAQRRNHSMLVIRDDLRTNEQNETCPQTVIYFRKHCLVSLLMQSHPEFDWFYVLDADTGVANPDHDLRDFLYAQFDLIFYERFYFWEVAAGNYIVKNTRFAQDFLIEWANMENELPSGNNNVTVPVLHSYDNGAIHLLLLRVVYRDNPLVAMTCSKLWYQNRYVEFIWCSVHYLRLRRCSQHIRILRRAHAWVLDRHILNDTWSTYTFMQHGWKEQQTGGGIRWSLKRQPSGPECDPLMRQPWPLRSELFLPIDSMRTHLRKFESLVQRDLGLPRLPDIGECWPYCELHDTSMFVSPDRKRLAPFVRQAMRRRAVLHLVNLVLGTILIVNIVISVRKRC